MKVYGPDGEKEQFSRVCMLLLVQNEISQIIAQALARLENHEGTEALLTSLRDKVSASDEPRFFVCDNANANRNLAERVFGSAVEVKQDPFHVIQRFTDKIKQPEKSKWLASTLSSTMYELDGNLRAHFLSQGFHVGKKAKADVNTDHLTVRSDLWADRVD